MFEPEEIDEFFEWVEEAGIQWIDQVFNPASIDQHVQAFIDSQVVPVLATIATWTMWIFVYL